MNDLELIPGHAEGWRVWRVIEVDGTVALRSVVFPFVWKPGEPIEAWCPNGSELPCVVHTCGVWAFDSKLRAVQYARSHGRKLPSLLWAVGKVAGAGRAVVHEDGWRAARAAVLSIDSLHSGRALGTVEREILSRLRDRYRLAVTLEV